MNYDLIKSAVAAVIKENGNEEITGNILQQALLATIDVLGLGYQYMGIATPSTVPGTPDAKVFYIAQAEGTYSNFNDGTSSPILDGTAIGLFAFDTQWHNTILDVATKSSVVEIVRGITEALADKIDKVADATPGNIPQFGNDGALTDSDIPATDVATKQELAVASLPGLAEAVIDTDGAGTEQQFAFRKSGGDGGAFYRKILGRSLTWGQLAFMNNVRSGSMTVTQDGNEVTATSGAGSNNNVSCDHAFEFDNHVYYFAFSYKSNLAFQVQTMNEALALESSANYVRKSYFGTRQSSGYGVFYWYNYDSLGAGDWVLNLKDIICFDLTQMFGAGNEPATAADFEKLFYLPYYAPNAGAFIHNATTKIKTNGFNQWDEQWENAYLNTNGTTTPYANIVCSKNYIPVFGGVDYYFKNLAGGYRVCFYDENKAFLSTEIIGAAERVYTIPTGARFMKFDTPDGTKTYNSGICINISDASKNGTYEPYWEREINLDLTTKKASDDTIPFPNGAMGAGTAQDWADEKGGEIVMDKVDLGSLSYSREVTGVNGKYRFVANLPNIKPAAGASILANIKCDKYTTISAADTYTPITGIAVNPVEYYNGALVIYVEEFAAYSVGDFIAAMQGVELVFERATRVPFTWKEPLKLGIKVDEDGTEQALPEQTATPTSAPFEAMTTYTMSIQRMVQKLAAL